MTVVLYILLALIIALCLALSLLNLYLKQNTYSDPYSHQPFISILVAARNEQENINHCMLAFLELNYPKEKYEILIGNDRSEDNTAYIVESFAEDHEQIRLINVLENKGKARGKSNVLAQLCREAKGDYIFVADADIEVSPNWIQAMLQHFDDNVGIVSGFTVTEEDNLFGKMQRIDWAYAMGMVKVVSDMGTPLVAVGNNMAFSKEAYDDTGGYESFDFSIVEDYQLFHEIVKQGYGYKNLMNEELTSTSKPHKRLSGLLQQRKRWMYGAFKLPMQILSILFLQAAYYPLIVALFFIDWKLGLNLFALKLFMQTVFISAVFKRIGKKAGFLYVLLFEIYQAFISVSSLVFYILPTGIKWKGRTY